MGRTIGPQALQLLISRLRPESRLRKAQCIKAIATLSVFRQPNPDFGESLTLIARKNI
ncbi:MAG: hypothetical protein F6K28_55490 [Microcoleus sp. SIO2G3]|nr:hypothetical protein [Microcoleus sp. SIO2G3]